MPGSWSISRPRISPKALKILLAHRWPVTENIYHQHIYLGIFQWPGSLAPDKCRNGSAAQGAVSRNMDIILMAEFDKPFLWKIRMKLNLVDYGMNAGRGKQSLQVGSREVGNSLRWIYVSHVAKWMVLLPRDWMSTYHFCFAFVDQFLHGSPGGVVRLRNGDIDHGLQRYCLSPAVKRLPVKLY